MGPLISLTSAVMDSGRVVPPLEHPCPGAWEVAGAGHGIGACQWASVCGAVIRSSWCSTSTGVVSCRSVSASETFGWCRSTR